MDASDTSSGLLDPNRIAVIGATDREDSVGRALLENLSTFDGEVLAVNPNRQEVLGMTCYDSIGSVPEAASIDLAIVVLPAPAVVETLSTVGDQGIRNVVVISAGFSETGPEGQQREAELIAVAEEYDLDLVGPNSIGIMSTTTGLDATFLQGYPPEGSLSLMSQSGAFIAAVVGWAIQHDIGFNNIVSLGNEAVLDETDFIARWDDDSETDVIVIYIEDIDNGQQFIEAAREVTDHTPIVVLKSGRTEPGAAAAKSHTGSMAGSDDAYEAGFEQAGVLRAMTIQDVFDYGQMLAGQRLPETNTVGIVTNGGGPGVLTTDAIDDSRLELAAFSAETHERLDAQLPEAADIANPLDIIGDADLERFRNSIQTVLADDSVGAVVVLSVPTAVYEFAELAELIGELQAAADKPVVACLMGGEPADQAAERLASYGIPTHFDPSRAVASLEALADYSTIADRVYEEPAEFDVDRERAREILNQTLEREVSHLGVEAIELLEAYGIPTPDGEIVESPAAAETVAERIGGPVAMKIVSPDIVHKSDIGGVEVGVRLQEVAETYETLLDNAASYDSAADILGVRIEALVAPDESTETIVGATRDPQFGHLLLFGFGGIFVEIFEDIAFRTAPLTRREAKSMTEEIQAAPMLRGARGRRPADLEAVIETIQRLSQLVSEFPSITELDVNPLVVAPEDVVALDVRLTVDRDELSASE